MSDYKLILGNKNYSSWSMRPWVAMRAAGIDFEDEVIPLDHDDTKQRILSYSAAGRVPILQHGNITVWESLAICEYVAERHPQAALWPSDPVTRAAARSVSHEMHAGFQALRKEMPMNCRRKPSAIEYSQDARTDIDRIQDIWRGCRKAFGASGPFLFGSFSIADAMYAPVVSRLDVYDVAVDGDSRAYMDAVIESPAFQDWLEDALRERWVNNRLEL